MIEELEGEDESWAVGRRSDQLANRIRPLIPWLLSRRLAAVELYFSAMALETEAGELQVKRVTVKNAKGATDDCLAVEEPLEIRVVRQVEGEIEEQSVSITMRTPGHDFELAVGFLHGEGLLSGPSDLQSLTPVLPERPGCNVVRVVLSANAAFDPEILSRHFYTTSSCGVCGKASLEALQDLDTSEIEDCRPAVKSELLHSLPAALRSAQSIFELTGGLHAAGLFAPQGDLVCVREDVGRHNAVDKVIGHELLQGRLPLLDSVLVVSGRTSFEILQKALAAGIPFVAAVSAPSSLAVEVAQQFGMTLVGFMRGQNFNIYSDAGRIR